MQRAYLGLLGALCACGGATSPAPEADLAPAPPDTAADTAVDAAPDTAPEAPPDASAPPDAEPDLAARPRAPYLIQAFDAARISSLGGDDGPLQATQATIDFAGGPFASAMLVVDLATTCYPFETWAQNPPPAGHNWPADCDAFDRNFELVLDPAKGPGAPPGIELMRAITPFGGPLHLELDVTDVANGLPGPHELRVFIATWSDGSGKVTGSAGGWNVSARFEMTPGPAPRKVLGVVPLFDGSLGPDGPQLSVDFEVPSGATSGRIEYRATGHGGGAVGVGCIGPSEEFCQRVHELRLDGEGVAFEMMWRSDCDELCTIAKNTAFGGFDYCLENPCGAIQSVKAPRANWCPGSLTPPYLLEAAPLTTPGPHSFGLFIPGMVPGGSWRVSAVYIAIGDPE